MEYSLGTAAINKLENDKEILQDLRLLLEELKKLV